MVMRSPLKIAHPSPGQMQLLDMAYVVLEDPILDRLNILSLN
jgi:hypothetical protein